MMTSPGDRRLPNPTSKVLLSTMKRIFTMSNQQRVQHRARHLKVIGSVGELEPSLEDLLAHSQRLEKRAPEQPGSTRQMLAIFCSPNRSKWLKEMNLPTLIIHGEADPLVPVEHGKALKSLMPHARLELFKDMGHDVPAPLYGKFSELMREEFLK